jgi:hypothetical protein
MDEVGPTPVTLDVRRDVSFLRAGSRDARWLAVSQEQNQRSMLNPVSRPILFVVTGVG